MARYSYTKVSTFEQCPYKFKLRYIDLIKPEIPMTIESFMGSLVHQALEELHKSVGTIFEKSKEGLLKFYNKLWNEIYSDDILIVKEGATEKDYRKKGEKFLEDYYDKHSPFNKFEVLGLETKDLMKLPDGNKWYVRIDMLAKDKDGNYYIIDHKTNSRMKTRWEIEEDKQLSMYSLWARENFPEAKSIKLVWNMLAFNEQIISEPTEEKLRKLQEDILIKIARIENAKDFPACVGPLCNYCEYKDICPHFKEFNDSTSHQSQKSFL